MSTPGYPFKSMPQGFRKLDVSNAIYLTDHDSSGKRITKKEFNNRIIEVEDFFVKLFGGHTRAALGKGEFMAKDKKIILENTVRIESFTDSKTFKAKNEELKNWILKKKSEWKQESIGYEFNGDLFYI